MINQIYDYIDAGFKVFGLYGVTNGRCDCGNAECQALYKHPRISGWQYTPNWSSEQIDIMVKTGQFDTGFGVLVDGYLVVDVDARNGGISSLAQLALPPGGFIVATGSGNGSKHIYYRLPPNVALRQKLDELPGIDFKTSGYVVGAGSMHASGNTYEIAQGFATDIPDAPVWLIDKLKRPEHTRATVNGQTIDVSLADIKMALSFIDPDCDYDRWIKTGMSLHHAGVDFEVWNEWSKKGRKYPGREKLDYWWHHFGKSANPITLGTLYHYAEAGGYRHPVTFTPDASLIDTCTDNIDLTRPPGFVGRVVDWINSQCRYPRERLAVAGALVAIGNIIGLRYVDELDGTTANLFAFCVAGSATGKEAILKAVAEIHRAAGIQPAVHGSIKSEQEITRNLTRHQASYYVIDEIGYLLKKITNAQQKGGAAYLDGIIGLLMSAYSKADSFLLLTGDAKEESRKALLTEMTQLKRAIAENEATADNLSRIERALEMIDDGLERPFVSLIGFTTPGTFDEFVTAEQATNGFIARALLFREAETNPKRKRRFKKTDMPQGMRIALAGLRGGYADKTSGRIDDYNPPAKIPTATDAIDLLDKIADEFEELAEVHKSKTGLEAIPRRGYELVSKISLILSAPEGHRTIEHVRWANALVRRDIAAKTSLAQVNTLKGSVDAIDRYTALHNRILDRIDSETGELAGTIRLRCKSRDYTALQVDQCLADLVRMGVAEEMKTVHPGNKKEVIRYRAKTRS